MRRHCKHFLKKGSVTAHKKLSRLGPPTVYLLQLLTTFTLEIKGARKGDRSEKITQDFT